MTSIVVLVALAGLTGLALLGACSSSSPAGDPDATQASPDAAVPDASMPEPDAAPLGPCNPVSQADCSSEQKCSIVPSATVGESPMLGCVANSGSLEVLQSCRPATATVPDDCARGLSCRGEDDPRCQEFCDQEPDSCSGADICLFAEDLDGDLQGDVHFCARICDVLLQDCTEQGAACYPTRDGEVCGAEGGGEPPAQAGEACEFANSCAKGNGCFRAGSSQDFLCFKICDADNTGGRGCAGNQFCNRHEADGWGVCIDLF